jgi:hypothetical protein
MSSIVGSDNLFVSMRHSTIRRDLIDTPYLEQAERCTQWVTSALSSPLLILELGAGFNTPGVVRFSLERLGARHAESRFVRINRDRPHTPARLNHRAIGIRGDAGEGSGRYGLRWPIGDGTMRHTKPTVEPPQGSE